MSCALNNAGESDPAKLYELAFDAGPAPLAFARRSGAAFYIERCNGAFAELFGLPRGSCGVPLSRAFRGVSADQLHRALAQSLQDSGPVRLRIAFGGADDRALLQVETRPVAAGSTDLALISVQQPRAPASLTALSEAGVLAEMGGLSRGLLYLHDLQRGYIRFAAHALQQRLGLPSGSIPAEQAIRVIDAADRPLVNWMLKRQAEARDGEIIQYPCRLRASDGDLIWAHVRAQVYSRTPDGKVQRILAAATDETDRRRLEARRAAAERALVEAEINERRRIGRELHDSTAQLLLAARLGLNALATRESLPGTSARILEDVRTSIEGAQRELRNVAFVLHPPALLVEGLEDALQAFADGFARRTGLAISLEVGRRRWRLPFSAEVALFRVAQEALMNVYRHARARTVVMRLGREGRQVILEVQDDGPGLAPEQHEGVGVSGMRARIAQAGGVFELASTPEGVLVRVAVPIERGPRTVVSGRTRHGRRPAGASGRRPIRVQGSA